MQLFALLRSRRTDPCPLSFLFRRRSDICAPEFEKLLHCVCQQGRSFLGAESLQLCEEIVQETLDDAAREWHVDDAFFEHHDLQDVVDCASDGDAILLNTSRTVQPRKQVEISKRLEIRASRSPDTLTKANPTYPPDNPFSFYSSRDMTKAILTCPPNDSLFFIRSVMECSRRCRLRSLPSTGMSMSC